LVVFDAPPAELVSAKDWALARIRARIHSGEFQPGVKLSIDGLASELGVSRTPVRDAVGQLEREGLVTIASRVGVFVRRLTRSEAADICRIKEAVEPLMARWAAERAPAGRRAAYRDAVAQLQAAAEDGDADLYVKHMERCRRELLELAGSSPLRDVLDVIDGRVRLLRYRNLRQPGTLPVSAGQHERIAAAVAAGDGDAAFAAMRDHQRDAARRMAQVLEEQFPDAGERGGR
jgi:GntR family transcriptional regulator, rspAB operon transcriptional repressor